MKGFDKRNPNWKEQAESIRKEALKEPFLPLPPGLTFDEVKRRYITYMIIACKGNVSAAADLLNLSPSTVYEVKRGIPYYKRKRGKRKTTSDLTKQRKRRRKPLN